MTPLELLDKATDALERAEQQGIGRDHALIYVKIARRCRGQTARIGPGLSGRIVSWGDGTWEMPTVVAIRAMDIVAVFVKAMAADMAEQTP